MKDIFNVNFGQWLPDLQDLDNPGCIEALNCLPSGEGYRAFRGTAALGDALPEQPLGSYWIRSPGGVVINFTGTASALYQLDGSTWIDRTPIFAYSGVTNWEFARFGSRVIAVSPENVPQYFDVDPAAGFTEFLDLPNAPIGERVAIIRDFVVLGAVGGDLDRMQWSGSFNSEIWDTPGRSTQSGAQTIYGGGGRIQKVLPNGIIFQEHGVQRMTYVGPPVIFRFDLVDDSQGTPAPESVVWVGERVFYLGWDGFYELRGNQPIPIGHNRVDRWFRERVGGQDALRSVEGVVDRRRGRIIWSFAPFGGAVRSEALIYDIHTDRWTHANIAVAHISELLSAGFSLDQLDQPGGPLPANIDAGRPDGSPFSVDSPDYLGGDLDVVVFDTAFRPGTFSGAYLTASIISREWRGAQGGRLFLGSARPIVERTSSTDLTVRAGTRDTLGGAVEWTDPLAVNRAGEARMREDGRYGRLWLQTTGDFDHAVGFQVEQRRSGRR